MGGEFAGVPEYGSSCQYCTEGCRIVNVPGANCGDGKLQSLYEECDGELGVGENQICADNVKD